MQLGIERVRPTTRIVWLFGIVFLVTQRSKEEVGESLNDRAIVDRIPM